MREPYDVVVCRGRSSPAQSGRGSCARSTRARCRTLAASRCRSPPSSPPTTRPAPMGSPGAGRATGLLYDAGKAPGLLGRRPNSWADALAPGIARKLASCGVALPDARDEMFIVAWRLMGVDPARVSRTRRQGRGRCDHSRARRGAAARVARSHLGHRRRRRLPHLRRRRPGRDRLPPQPRRRRRARDPIRRAEGGRPDRDRRARRAARRAASERGAGADRFPSAPLRRRGSDRRRGADERGSGSAGQDFRALWPVGVYEPALLSVIEREWARARAPAQQEHAPADQAGRKAEPARDESDDRRDRPTSSSSWPTRWRRRSCRSTAIALARAPHMQALARERRRLRQRLLRKPALFALARLVHGRAPAVAHPRLRQRGRILGRHPDLRPSSAAARLPDHPVRQDAFLRPGPVARLRGAADDRHLSRRLRLDARLGSSARSGRAGTTT